MDAIKKKMQSLKSETDNSLARAEQLDTEAKEANALAEKTEEHVSIRTILENPFDYNCHFSFCQILFVVLYLGSRSSKEDATC